MGPLVSICIPSYNNAKYITETIQSVLNQEYQNFELIIVDDCSKDNTVEAIRAFTDKRIRLYENPVNLGMHGNWNKALSFASGEYMMLLCGDDIIYHTCISSQLKAFQDNKEKNLSMVSVHRALIKANGKETPGAFYKFPAGFYTGKKAMRSCVVFGTNLIGEPMSVLFRASVFKENHIILACNNYTIDLDMYAKLLQYGNLLVLKDTLAAFRIYNESMSGSLGFKHFRQFKEFVNQEYMSRVFEVKWYHRMICNFVTFNLTIVRNIIIFFSNF
jgi:glycosyltransferase involved in cell wall biosynthesis